MGVGNESSFPPKLVMDGVRVKDKGLGLDIKRHTLRDSAWFTLSGPVVYYLLRSLSLHNN